LCGRHFSPENRIFDLTVILEGATTAAPFRFTLPRFLLEFLRATSPSITRLDLESMNQPGKLSTGF